MAVAFPSVVSALLALPPSSIRSLAVYPSRRSPSGAAVRVFFWPGSDELAVARRYAAQWPRAGVRSSLRSAGKLGWAVSVPLDEHLVRAASWPWVGRGYGTIARLSYLLNSGALR